MNLGGWEIFAILLVALLLFGSRLPNVMRSLGKSVTEFKKGMNEITEDPTEAARNRPQAPVQYQAQAPAAGQPQDPQQRAQG